MDLNESAIIKEISEVFASDNNELIHDTISYIHENGSVKMIPLLFNLLLNTDNDSIKNDIYNCLADTKDKESIPLFIQTLLDPKYSKEKTRLISTLWLTNMDFSEHIDVFVDILINDSYEMAIEALTLIGICAPNLSDKQKSSLKNKISKQVNMGESEKTALLHEAIHILE